MNGVDHHPWFSRHTFSARALAANPFPVMHAYPFWSEALKYGGPMDPPSTRIFCGLAALVRAYAGDPQKPVWAGEFNTCIESLTRNNKPNGSRRRSWRHRIGRELVHLLGQPRCRIGNSTSISWNTVSAC